MKTVRGGQDTLPLLLSLVVSSGDTHSPQTRRVLAKVCQLTSSKTGLGLAWRPDAWDRRPWHATCGRWAGASCWTALLPDCSRVRSQPDAVWCGHARDVLSCSTDLCEHTR